MWSTTLYKLYYTVKPMIPRRMQIELRRMIALRQLKKCQDVWPINQRAAAKPAGWPGWPDGKQFAVVLTHDVDTARGHERCRELMELEKKSGFLSSFNFVPERYTVSEELRKELVRNGFEIGVHGLYHDGKYYRSREIFQERAIRINHYLKQWDAVGYRSPSMHHNLDWINDLNIEYDASTFDTDPFEPQSDGATTIFPFWFQPNGSEKGFVELPYTLPQDFTLFILMREPNVDIWKRKIDWIAQNNGMVLMNTHPDYMHFGGTRPSMEDYPSEFYKDVLAYIKAKYSGRYWQPLPRHMGEYVSAQKTLLNAIPEAVNPVESRAISKKDSLNACMLGYFDYDTDSRVQNYVTMLLQKGYAVDIICCGEKNSEAQGAGPRVSVFSVQSRKIKEKTRLQYIWNLVRFFGRAMVKVSTMYFRKRYKVIHVHNVPDFLIFTAWLPKMLGARLILDIHDILPEFYARKFNVPMTSRLISFLKFIEKISCSFANHVIVANDIWRDRVAQRSARPEKCTSFINYLDTSVIPISASIRQAPGNGTFKLIYHGTYSEHHGLDVAIKAVAILRGKIGPFKLLMYGGGPYKNELLSLIQTLGVESNIDIREAVSYQDVPKILKEADLGIVPKKDGIFVGEAISTKLFQYVAMGIPAVVSRTVAEQRYFGEDEVKFFTPGNPEDMARCIQELYENPQSRLAMARRALRKMEGYSLPANTSKYVRIIDHLTSGNKR